MSEELRYRIAGALGPVALAGLFGTISFQIRGSHRLEEARGVGGNVVFAFWHGQMLPLLHHHRGRGVVTLVSRHRDGEYVTRVLERSGYGAVRGSTSRGAAAGLRGLVRAAKAGADVAITPDGPRGPFRTFQRGALAAARLSGLPVVPVAAGANRAWRLDSWDRFLIPKPFSAVAIEYGDAVTVPREADEGHLTRLAQDLSQSLGRLCERVGDAA